ncbi:thiol-disulfide oxidoreductase DCC family protein [Tundrisphaera lichenicola]|uniref:thiol-disulfide oxidoreductase DCC family protein n=1 Tax=Tundrisphaera lichenicola TaxID=2029860 RepID=UPI003EB7F14E
MRRLYVLYDARCGLCRWARQWLDRQEKLVDLEFIPAGSEIADRMFPTLATSDCPEELLVVSDEGGVYRGGNAWIMCLYALEEHREWAERLSSPALIPLARQGFALLSKQRGRISRWLGLASEHEIVQALGGIDAPSCEINRLAAPPESPPFQDRVQRLAHLARQVKGRSD